MLSNNKLIKKYVEIYQGNDAYYLAKPTNETKTTVGGVKQVYKYVRARGKIDNKVYENHIKGKCYLVLSPLKADATCNWGAIDVDTYSKDFIEEIISKVTDTPLIHTRSTSGGLHLYLYSKEFINAGLMRNALKVLAAKLGLDKIEIFPKQETHSDKGVGNGLKLACYKTDENNLAYHLKLIEHKLQPIDYFKSLPIHKDEKKSEHQSKKESKVDTHNLDEIIKNIQNKKTHSRGGDVDNHIVDFVSIAAGLKWTDKSIIEKLLIAKEQILQGRNYAENGNFDDYITVKINSFRKKYDVEDPDITRDQFLKNVIYIRKLDLYFNRKLNDVYKKETINVEFSHLMPKKISAVSYLADHKKRILVENFQYRPELYNPNEFIFEVAGKKYINTYKPNLIEPIRGKLELWEELLDYLFPNLETKTHMEDFISVHVQNPGKKIRHAPLIVSPHQRIGKGRMFAAIRKILGEENTAEIDLTRALNQSKDYLTNKQLVLIDELKSESNWSEAQKLLNTLKRNITEEWHGSRFLYQDFKDIYSCTNYILFSNHTNALSINKNDERYWVVRCDVSPKQQIFYKHFSDWLKTPEAAQHLLWHYKNREISENFDTDGHAPRTIWSNQMSNEGKHPFVQRVVEDFEQNLMPFINDIVSIVDVRIHYKNVGIGKVRANEIHNALLEVGGKKLGQSKVSLLDREWFPTLYSIRNHEKYENVPVNQLGALYTPLFHPDTEKDL